MKSPFTILRDTERERKQRMLDRRKLSAVNIMEFDGVLCIASDGVPLFPLDGPGLPDNGISEALDRGREIWKKWYMLND